MLVIRLTNSSIAPLSAVWIWINGDFCEISRAGRVNFLHQGRRLMFGEHTELLRIKYQQLDTWAIEKFWLDYI